MGRKAWRIKRRGCSSEIRFFLEANIKETIKALKENHPELYISEEDEEDFCISNLGFYGGALSTNVLGEIERLRERRRLVNNVKDLFGQQPEIAKKLLELLEQAGGVERLKTYLSYPKEGGKMDFLLGFVFFFSFIFIFVGAIRPKMFGQTMTRKKAIPLFIFICLITAILLGKSGESRSSAPIVKTKDKPSQVSEQQPASISLQIVNDEVYDQAIKTQVSQHIYVSGNLSDTNLNGLLMSQYKSIMNKGGHRYHNPPTNVYIYLYDNIADAQAGLSKAKWIAMLQRVESLSGGQPQVTLRKDEGF